MAIDIPSLLETWPGKYRTSINNLLHDIKNEKRFDQVCTIYDI
jgi:hypothetical protein